MPLGTERSAARLAHQSGGLGVPSSNLGAPTKPTPKALISRIYLNPQINYDYTEYTNRNTSGRFGWWGSRETATDRGARASGFLMTCARNTPRFMGRG